MQRLNAGERGLILTPDPIEWQALEEIKPTPYNLYYFTGCKKVVYENPKTLAALRNMDNGFLVFDDCRTYFRAITDDNIAALYIRRAQKMLDIFAVAHGFTETPPRFFTYASEYIIFRTEDSIDRRKDFFNDEQKFMQVKATAERVNQKAVTDPHYFEIVRNKKT